jgi:hypothetical protein
LKIAGTGDEDGDVEADVVVDAVVDVAESQLVQNLIMSNSFLVMFETGFELLKVRKFTTGLLRHQKQPGILLACTRLSASQHHLWRALVNVSETLPKIQMGQMFRSTFPRGRELAKCI